MSYNIDSVTVLVAEDFGITGVELNRLRDELTGDDTYQDFFPEINVFQNPKLFSGPLGGALVFLPGQVFPWSGEGANLRSYEFLCQDVLPQFSGKADLLVVWEGGDSTSGLRLNNHRVTEHEVVQGLGPEKRK